MTLYLVRHGEPKREAEDPQRALTDQGKLAVSKVAAFLRRAGVPVTRIWHSTKPRAIETAQVIAHTLSLEGTCEQREGLSPNDPVEPIVTQIHKVAAEREQERLMIVGHLPFLPSLAALLVAGSASASVVEFHQGGVVCLQHVNQRAWQLSWAIIPELLP